MKEKRVFHAIGSVNDKFIEEMYAPGEAKKKTINHHPAKRMWLIAAIITVMVFMMGCAIVYALDLESRGEYLKILHAPGFINLDCGCGYNMPIKALACIRLEDMVEYYT